MNNFCTLFNSNYAARGLAMYHSLAKCSHSFHLYIFAFDNDIFDALTAMDLPYVTVISLKEFEDERLLKVKKERTAREYCWTCESLTIQYCLRNFNIDNCTYIDADLIFYSDPKVLIDEMGNDDVLLTEHRYASDLYYSGRFCVQFMTFKNTENGLKVLNWWCDRVLECCQECNKDGFFGDQMYLEDWPERFEGIHVLKHLGGGVAPWNSLNYTFSTEEGYITGKDIKTGEKFYLVFYHFHNLHIKRASFYIKKHIIKDLFGYSIFRFAGYEIPNELINLIYRPYIKDLIECAHRFDTKINALGTPIYSGFSLFKLLRMPDLTFVDKAKITFITKIRK